MVSDSLPGVVDVPNHRLLEEIASGASGTVYRAVQVSLGREVALKLLAPGLFGAEETRARFLRESKLQARLTHANLVTIFDAGFVGERPYLSVELVTGGTLRGLMARQGELPIDRAVALAGEIAAGLAHAHEAGIVHRDLKPENVLLTESGVAKIADFGLAKALAGSETLETASGVVLGTPGYIAPETLEGEPMREPGDVYSLGAMLYELLAGRLPFVADSLGDLFRAQLAGRVPQLDKLRPGVSADLSKLVALALHRDPSQRPTAREVAARLERLGPAPGPARRAEAPAPPCSPRATLQRQPPASYRNAAGTRVLSDAGARPMVPERLAVLAGLAGVALAAGAWLGADRLAVRAVPSPAAAPVESVPPSPRRPVPAPPPAAAGPPRRPTTAAGTPLRKGTVLRKRAGPKGAVSSPPTIILSAETTLAGDLATSSSGAHVAAAWVHRESGWRNDVLVADSYDGGKNWIPTEILTTGGETSGSVGILVHGGVTHVVWAANEKPPEKGQQRSLGVLRYCRKSGPSEGWQPVATLGPAWPDFLPGLAADEGGRLFILYAASTDETRLQIEPARPGERWVSVAGPPLKGSWRHVLVHVEGRLLALIRGERQGKPHDVRVWTSERSTDAAASWSEPVALTAREDTLGILHMARVGKRVLAAYKAGSSLVVRTRDVGDAAFSEPRTLHRADPFVEGWSLSATEGGWVAGWLERGLLDATVKLHASTDGVRWEATDMLDLHGLILAKKLELAAWTGGTIALLRLEGVGVVAVRLER